MDRAIVRAPKPICTALTQPGDFSEDILLYIIRYIITTKSIKKLNLEKSSTY
jgi:hypothetical protein